MIVYMNTFTIFFDATFAIKFSMGSLIRELILVVARVVNWSIIGHIFALCILLFLVVIPSFWVIFLVDCCLLVRVALLKIPETFLTMFFLSNEPVKICFKNKDYFLFVV